MVDSDTKFRELVEPYRGELQVHCYRLLGSLQDAEDVLQETMLAAWRGLDGFEGRSSIRTWLYKIATNRCLNALRDGKRRPWSFPLSNPPVTLPDPTRTVEPLGLQPYPDVLFADLPDEAPGPEARYEAKESISLAFVTAVQALPARQRAALVLRDVLGYRAAEVADLLDTSEDSVTSALRRARAAVPAPPSADVAAGREVGDQFADAIEAGDVDAMVRLLTDDAWLTMPPAPLAYQGHAAIANFMRVVGFRSGLRRYRLLPTAGANGGQPAFGCYVADGDQITWRPHGLLVLTVAGTTAGSTAGTIAGDRVSAMTRFIDNDLLPYFGLPDSLD
jgi:RNA polymerase sigma-70 factor (TIGR02960 family)